MMRKCTLEFLSFGFHAPRISKIKKKHASSNIIYSILCSWPKYPGEKKENRKAYMSFLEKKQSMTFVILQSAFSLTAA